MSLVLLVALGSVGPFGPAGFPGGYGLGYGHSRAGYGYGNGYGYGYGIPLPAYDPIGYYRYYNGSGTYWLRPTPVFPPRVITLAVPGVMEMKGVTGRVVKLDEETKTITLRLPAETVSVIYGPGTRFRALDDSFPEIAPGMILNVDEGVVTVVKR